MKHLAWSSHKNTQNDRKTFIRFTIEGNDNEFVVAVDGIQHRYYTKNLDCVFVCTPGKHEVYIEYGPIAFKKTYDVSDIMYISADLTDGLDVICEKSMFSDVPTKIHAINMDTVTA